MNVKTRLNALELKLSSGTCAELVELLHELKSQNGDDSPTPEYMDAAECLRQIAAYLPA